jgi:SAM-dependent methyltransferase
VSWDAVALRHGTDKASSLHGLPAHGYMRRYEREMAGAEISSLLEIGVANGESLRMWAELLPEARIVGVDVAPDCAQHETERIAVIIADATVAPRMQLVARAHGPFDVIVDDGSHHPPDAVASFAALFPYLRPGGAYFIEDLSWDRAGWVASGLIGHDIARLSLESDGELRPSGGPCLITIRKES